MQMTDVYINPPNDVDIFYTQTVSSVTAVLDALAPLRTHVKRRGKRSSRWLSDTAIAGKRTRRQLAGSLEADWGRE